MMGGTGLLLRPAAYTGLASYYTHTRRNPPSQEPGVDYYMPRGTPLRAAAAGRVIDVGDSIDPATGRFVMLGLGNGQAVRYLHLERRHVSMGDDIPYGHVFADSGATGYGSPNWENDPDTGGSHVHVTLFPTWNYNNFRGLLDFHAHSEDGEEDMDANQASQLDAIYKALFGPNNGALAAKAPLSWANIDGDGQLSSYGLLPISIHNQSLINGLSKGIAAIAEQISTGGVDLDALADLIVAKLPPAGDVEVGEFPTPEEYAAAVVAAFKAAL